MNNETTNVARCKDCKYLRTCYRDNFEENGIYYTCGYLENLGERDEDEIACVHFKLKEKRP